MTDEIDFDDEELAAASHWHGGQGSMLYAVSSTGALRRGTIRPRHEEGGSMTDEEWMIDLAERLEGEAESAARDAAKQAKKAKGTDRAELRTDREGLRGIAFKAAQFVRDAKRAKTSSHATKKAARRGKEHEGSSKSREANVLVYSRPSGYWYAQAHDATTGAQITDATGYSREEVLRALRGKFAIIGVTIKSIIDKDPYMTGHAKKPTVGAHHATKKSPTQLDREIAQRVGRRIDRKKLGEMMSPWGGDFAYGEGTGAVGAVSSYYYSGKKYPDRTLVERALKAVEADAPKAEHGAHGWTKSDAKDLRTIASGLRYYLNLDYKG
jgi:hypothetical protein